MLEPWLFALLGAPPLPLLPTSSGEAASPEGSPGPCVVEEEAVALAELGALQTMYFGASFAL
jgi:hypothetical protein